MRWAACALEILHFLVKRFCYLRVEWRLKLFALYDERGFKGLLDLTDSTRHKNMASSDHAWSYYLKSSWPNSAGNSWTMNFKGRLTGALATRRKMYFKLRKLREWMQSLIHWIFFSKPWEHETAINWMQDCILPSKMMYTIKECTSGSQNRNVNTAHVCGNFRNMSSQWWPYPTPCLWIMVSPAVAHPVWCSVYFAG